MYLPRRTSFSLEERPKFGRTPSSSSIVSFHVHQSYLASQVGQLSSQLGLGLDAPDDEDRSVGADPSSTSIAQTDAATRQIDDRRDSRLTAAASGATESGPRKVSRLDDFFVGADRSTADKAKTSGSHGAKHASLRGYAETRWKRQERLESKIMQSSDIRRLEWEAKAAMLKDSYPLAILLLHRAGMLGSASSCISLARLYAFGITKGNTPVVVMVYRDPLRSLAWSLEALAILERRLSAQIKAASASAAVSRRLRELWDAPLDAVALLLRAIIAPEVAALSPSQRNAVALPDISRLSGSQSAGRDALGSSATDRQKEDLWIRTEDAVSRLAVRLPSCDIDTSADDSSRAPSLGPDEEDDEQALQKQLDSLREHAKCLKALLKSRQFVLDPQAELVEGLRSAWSSCVAADAAQNRNIEPELQLYATKALACLGTDPSSNDVANEGHLFQPLILSLDQLLPELSIPDFANRKARSAVHESQRASHASTEAKNKRPRRDSLKEMEPEDVETAAKHEASVRPALTMRLASRPAVASASVASVVASGHTQESGEATPSVDSSRQRLTRTISRQGGAPTSIDLGTARSPPTVQEMERRRAIEPPSPALSTVSVGTDYSFNNVRPRRPSSVVSVTPSLLFPPGATEDGRLSPGDERQMLFPADGASSDLPRSRTASQLSPGVGGPRPRLASAGLARPRVTSMYSAPSMSGITASSSAHFSTSSTAADKLSSLDSSLSPPESGVPTRRRTSSNASLSSLSRNRGMPHMISKTSPSISETPEQSPLAAQGIAGAQSEVAAGSVSAGAGGRKASDTLRRLKGQRSNSKLHSLFASDGSSAATEPVPAVPSWAKAPAASLLRPSASKATIAAPTAGRSDSKATTTTTRGVLTARNGPAEQNTLTAAQSLERSRMVHANIPSVLEEAETVMEKALVGPAFTSALIAGAMSGLTVDLLFYPIDTIKTRLQSAQGFLAAGGFKGVYRGLGSTAVGSAPGASVFFTTYESMKPALRRLAPDVFGEHGTLGPAGLHMASASIAETAACLIRVPTEVVKSRQQTSTYGAKTSTAQAFKMVFKESGVRGYYRGFAGTVGREIPFTCIQFPLYERLKLEMSRSSMLGHDALSGVSNEQRVRDLPTWQAGIAGSIAGAIAAGLTTPLDVVKTRIMLNRNTDPSSSALPRGVNTRILPTLSHIFKTEGPRALFSGFVPRTMWIGLGGAVFLGTFDAGVKVLDG